MPPNEVNCDGLVKKKILYAGSELPNFQNGAKLTFHFKTTRVSDGGCETVLDDSKKAGRPMELLLGKKFKMPVWEQCLKTMRIGEVAQFTVDKALLHAYPFVSKSYRQFAGVIKNDEGHQSHCCSGLAIQKGVGHPDLDQWIQEPSNLDFVIELLKVELPGAYEKESWTMEPEEKLRSIPKLQEEGNALYRKGEHSKAAEKYREALTRLEQLLLREKPGDEEWRALEKIKIPLLLNFSQCRLLDKDYYAVIQHTSDVLEKDPDNVKALFRRAKAHLGAWNPDDARVDFKRTMELDPSLRTVVLKELRELDRMQREKDKQDRDVLKGKLFT